MTEIEREDLEDALKFFEDENIIDLSISNLKKLISAYEGSIQSYERSIDYCYTYINYIENLRNKE
jgi:hypothetical protein